MNKAFICLPAGLFGGKYASLSSDAKLLYSILLDKWLRINARSKEIDKPIWLKIDEAMILLNCSKQKAVNVFKELEDMSLIKRSKLHSGLGLPADIYVKDTFNLEDAIFENI